MNFQWYTNILTNELEQGDFLEKCPIIIPPELIEEGSQPEVEVEYIDSIILSQSCDLVNEKLEIVLVCPYYSLQTFLDSLPEGQKPTTIKSKKKIIEELKKGQSPGYHLLNKDSEYSIKDYIVVDFKNVYGVHFLFLKEFVKKFNNGNRIRLLPPYREHLSQAFARYFMRVGLPQDIIIEGYY
ncbi:MAG: hypothetical protein M3512_12085 [Bacteroidota bacterium]|nr:hypothetical protein [Bacteroidota bacterium]